MPGAPQVDVTSSTARFGAQHNLPQSERTFSRGMRGNLDSDKRTRPGHLVRIPKWPNRDDPPSPATPLCPSLSSCRLPNANKPKALSAANGDWDIFDVLQSHILPEQSLTQEWQRVSNALPTLSLRFTRWRILAKIVQQCPASTASGRACRSLPSLVRDGQTAPSQTTASDTARQRVPPRLGPSEFPVVSIARKKMLRQRNFLGGKTDNKSDGRRSEI